MRPTPPRGSFCAGTAGSRLSPASWPAGSGAADAIRDTGAFFEVTELAHGGVWCQATEEFDDCHDAALLKVFQAVAPVLRTGTPWRFDQVWRGEEPRLIFRDAADPGNPSPPPPRPITFPDYSR
jgi:hypothetical protein